MTLLSQAAAQINIQELAIGKDHLITAGKTQARLKLDPQTVDEYAALLRTCLEEGKPWPFPAVKIVRHTHRGAHFDYVWDGFHRIAAARQANWPAPIPALVRPGTQRDAILAAVGANADHGLRRTNEDKRRAVTLLLMDDEWCQWSDRMIADKAKVTHPFVAKIRAELAAAGTTHPLPGPDTTDDAGEGVTGNGYQSAAKRTGRDGRTIDTSRIGNTRSDNSQTGKAKPYAEVWQLEKGIRSWLAQPHVKALNASPDALKDMANRYPGAPAQADLNDYLPAPRRKRDMIQAFNNVANQLAQSDPQKTQGAAQEPPTLPTAFPPNPVSHRRRLRNPLIAIDGMFAARDEDDWVDVTGNTRMSQLRRLVKDMLTDLDQ